VNALV
jgi:hypothetical protein